MTGYNGDEQEFLTSSGGGEKFLQFLHEELFAEIESDYRTLPHRTLVGHSFGGLAALHALVHAPGMFRNHIAIDPSLWWHNQLLVSQAADAFVEDHNYAGAVYISLANNPPLGDADPKIMENAGREFASILAGVNNESFSSAMGFYENDDHGSVPLVSLYDGLLTIFDGYEIDPERLVEDPLYINEHFERVSAMMGVDFPPPEAAINDFGYFFLYGVEDYEAAITTMQLNVEHYPDSYNVYDSLAEVYAANGDTELAIANYEKSLELNPDNENAQEQIEALLDNSREETEAQE
jgi:tetratricopeptide (TPR) repeat protein